MASDDTATALADYDDSAFASPSVDEIDRPSRQNGATPPPPDDHDAPDDADSGGPAGQLSVDDFFAVMTEHRYLFVTTRELWPAASVNARVAPVVSGGTSIKAAAWLDANRAVEQVTWAPGEPMVIRDRVISDGGWLARVGCTGFNLYRPPIVEPGNAALATPWLDHIGQLYPAEQGHIVRWLAHRVQRPGEKPNHALMLGGPQGIGKDTLLEPVKYGVGAWNCKEVSPVQLIGRFNGFLKSVLLRVSEARDLGDIDRFAFYEHIKNLSAAPPDALRCDEKNLREYYVPNVCGVVLTTNHKTDGIYLPADDRRHFVAWSDCTRDAFPADYWRKRYAWYAAGGLRHVAAYLREFDLSGFDAKAPPPKTEAWWAIVDANRAPEDAELTDALDHLGDPPPRVVTLTMLASKATETFASWLLDRRNSRRIPHRLEAVGYVPIRNEGTKDGRWKIGGANMVLYARAELSTRDRLEAAGQFAEARRR